MMTSNTERKREQMQFVSMDDLVPQDHMLRLIDIVRHCLSFDVRSRSIP